MFKTVNNGGGALVTHHQVIDQDLKIDSYQDLWRNSRREFRRGEMEIAIVFASSVISFQFSTFFAVWQNQILFSFVCSKTIKRRGNHKDRPCTLKRERERGGGGKIIPRMMSISLSVVLPGLARLRNNLHGRFRESYQQFCCPADINFTEMIWTFMGFLNDLGFQVCMFLVLVWRAYFIFYRICECCPDSPTVSFVGVRVTASLHHHPNPQTGPFSRFWPANNQGIRKVAKISLQSSPTSF